MPPNDERRKIRAAEVKRKAPPHSKEGVIDDAATAARSRRDEAQNLMTNWLSTNTPFDGVIANNDESAIGAIQALKAAGKDVKEVVVGGVDATQDALAAMQAGELDVTVFPERGRARVRLGRRGGEAGEGRTGRAKSVGAV
jgi:ABC-type sugar transport system substrate-binding protein